MNVYIRGSGGLGNVLFHLASAIYYCEKYNFELKIVKTATTYMVNGNFMSYAQTIFSKLQFIDNVEGDYVTVHNDLTCDVIIPQEKNILISGHNHHINTVTQVMDKISNYLFLDDTNIKNYILEKYPNIQNSTIICVRIEQKLPIINLTSLSVY